MDTDHGRVASDRAGGLRPQPPAASSPVGAHPSREPLGAYVGVTSAYNRKYPEAGDIAGEAFEFLPINRPINFDDLQTRSDADLIEHAVRIARPKYRSRAPRWVAVMDTFALGRTAAIALCNRFDMDPEEVRVRR